ncbi:hypothetical protein QBC39DRAFT_436146 [Podospora conica]|nr:hypothetical protein QBC39DRAFT_436146 [Schizothecium conicum]
MPTPPPPPTILLIGHGSLGTSLLTALTSHPSYHPSHTHLTILRRPSPTPTPLPPHTTLLPTDILTTPLPALTALLAPFHTIITTTGFSLPPGTQTRLARAALAAGVKRYIPWQFGLDYAAIGRGSGKGLFDEQLDVRGMLAAQVRTEWTVVSTGVFMEFLVDPAVGFGVLEVAGARSKVTALGGWERRVSMTATGDVGRMVAEVVFDPPGERVVFVAGDTLSYGEVAGVVGRVYGEEGLERAVLGDEELKRRVEEGGDGMDEYRAVFGRGVGTAWEKEATLNFQRGIELVDFETFLREYKAKQG